MIELNYEHMSVSEALDYLIYSHQVSTVYLSKSSFIAYINALGNFGPKNPAVEVAGEWSFILRKFNEEIGFHSIEIHCSPSLPEQKYYCSNQYGDNMITGKLSC